MLPQFMLNHPALLFLWVVFVIKVLLPVKEFLIWTGQHLRILPRPTARAKGEGR